MAAFYENYNPSEVMMEALVGQAEAKASFCLATGVQPSEYDNLTLIEIEQFIKEANRRSKKGSNS